MGIHIAAVHATTALEGCLLEISVQHRGDAVKETSDYDGYVVKRNAICKLWGWIVKDLEKLH